MLEQWVRIVTAAQPVWFILENVPRVPSISVAGYGVQRFNLAAKECGGSQARLRCFQFGNLVKSIPLVIPRSTASRAVSRAALASEGTRKGRRTFADFCELQGLPRDFDLPGLSIAAKYRAVGNGVPLQLGRVIARAVAAWAVTDRAVRVCLCNCGRPVTGRQTLATAACRKRMERRRRDSAGVTELQPVTAAASHIPLSD
jgi:DNA (cytosine-5)-methyltransferase 1